MKLRLFLALSLILMRFGLQALGGHEATRFLAGNAVSAEELALGAAYVLIHLAAVIIAPILILSHGVERYLLRRSVRARAL